MTTQTRKNEPATPLQDENSIMAERRAKLAVLRQEGIAYPNDFHPTHKAASLHEQYDDQSNETLEPAAAHVCVAGRMMLKRVMGKASFATLMDASGPRADGRIQLFISNDTIGKEAHDAFKHYDIGDILGAEGTLFKTKTGETDDPCHIPASDHQIDTPSS